MKVFEVQKQFVMLTQIIINNQYSSVLKFIFKTDKQVKNQEAKFKNF
jgi:hypothetical protein